ncbi:unnamed protein product [Leuciscus chuanchicus]
MPSKRPKSSGARKIKKKDKKNETPDEGASESGKCHPEHIFPLVLTSVTQEMFGCRADEDVTGENPYKLLRKKEIVQDMKTRAAVSDFSPVKQIVLEYPEDELLLVFDRDFTYGQCFYLVLTVEAKENMMKSSPAQAADDEELMEDDEEDVIEPETPESHPWISLGSEQEIEDESLTQARPRAPQPAGPSGQLGKEQTRPRAEDLFSRYGVGFGRTEQRAQSVLNCLNTFKGRMAVPLKFFQRLLGHIAAAAAVTSLGLLHMRPLQHWLHGRVPRWAWHHGTHRVAITPECRQTFSPWSDPSFLRAGVPFEQVSRHAVVFTDASATGWGATYNGHAVSRVWTDPQLHWHINCLELLAVRLALSRLKRLLQGRDVLVRTDNTATVAYINRQGGLRSRRMSQLARHLLLWSQKHLRSL